MSIKLFQTERVWASVGTEILDLVQSAHGRGEAQNGQLTKDLESVLAQKYRRQYCITVGSCTDALDISLQALQLAKNTSVAVSNYTFTASAHAIQRAGYQVTPVDVDPHYCIDPDLINNVGAIVAVDLFGNMTRYSKLNQLGIPVIVDAAQSLESHNGDCWSAEYGFASCISFSPSKPISSWGSGGAILTDDYEFAERCRRLRLHGKLKNTDQAISSGLNSMMSSFECAAVLVGLQYQHRWFAAREKISQYLIQNSRYATGNDTSITNSFSKLVFQSDSRSEVIQKFKDNNIDAVVHYTTLIGDEKLYQTSGLTNSKNLQAISFTIPNQHTLTDLEVEKIAKVLQ